MTVVTERHFDRSRTHLVCLRCIPRIGSRVPCERGENCMAFFGPPVVVDEDELINDVATRPTISEAMAKKADAPHPLAEALAVAMAEDPHMPESTRRLVLAIRDTVLAIAEDIAAIRAHLEAMRTG